MSDDRRGSERFPVQRPAIVRFGGDSVVAVCTNVSSEGGFLRCPLKAQLGDIVDVSIQPRRASRPDIAVQGEVVYVSAKGDVDRRGLGLRWLQQQDPAPLDTLVNWAKNMEQQGLLDTGTRMVSTQLEIRADGETKVGE